MTNYNPTRLTVIGKEYDLPAVTVVPPADYPEFTERLFLTRTPLSILMEQKKFLDSEYERLAAEYNSASDECQRIARAKGDVSRNQSLVAQAIRKLTGDGAL